MKKFLSALLSLCMLLSITAGLDFTAYAATYSKISNLQVPRFIQYVNSTYPNGDGTCVLASMASIYCYSKGNTYNGKKYYYKSDYNHDDPVYKLIKSYNNNQLAIQSWANMCSKCGFSQSDSVSWAAIYNQLKAGKPVLIYTTSHTSVVIGYNATTTGNAPNPSNFVVMDVSQYYSQSKCYKSLSSWVKGRTITKIIYPKSITPITTQYTVTFKGNGADSISASSVKVNSGSALGDNIATATRVGYSFDGWYTATSGGTKYSTGSPKVESNVTLYAQWKANEFPLEYNRIYRFVNVNSGLAVEADSSDNKAPVKQRSVSNSYNQLWKAYIAGNGEYVLRLVNGGRYMDLSGGSNALRTPFQIFNEASSSNYDNQCFSFINRGSGKYSVHSAKSGRAWHISGASKDSGAQLQQYYYYSGANQQFYIQEFTNRDITFYDNLSNNYFVSLESSNASNSFKTRATSYVTCSVDKIKRMLTINASKAGSASNSMTWWTTCNDSYNYEMGSYDEYDSVANLRNGKKYLIFRAKSNVNGAKINFRWGYDSTTPIATATLSTSNQVFCLEMPRTENSGQNIHPWVDRACTIQMDNILLVDSTDDYNIHLDDSAQSATYNINSNNGCFPTSLPNPKSIKSGCHFLGWYSKRVGGYKIKSTNYMQYNQNLYAHWEVHKFDVVSSKVAPTCATQGYTVYKCSCGETEKRDYVNATGHNFGDNSPTCLSCGKVNPNYVAPQVTITDVNSDSSNSSVDSQYNNNDYYSEDYYVNTTNNAKPKKTSIKKLTNGKKSFKVTWSKISGVTGYQVQYATDKKFKKNKKTVTVKGAKTTSKTIKNLKAKKKYYVRVRAYKTVNGTKYYSSWSKVKTVTTKK